MTSPGFVGGDTRQMFALAGSMDQVADQLGRIRQVIESRLRNSTWCGRDAEEFRQLWSARLGPKLAGAAVGMSEAARRLRQEATEQEQASVSGGSSSPFPSDVEFIRLPHFVQFFPMPQPDLSSEVLGFLQRNLSGVSAVDLLHGLRSNLDTLDNLGIKAGLDELGKVAPPGLLNAIGIGISLGTVLDEASRGELSASSVVDLVLSVGGLHPVGAALETGVFIGRGLADILQETTGYQDKMLDVMVRNRYGDELSVREATEMVERYDGFTGYFNIAGDAVKTGWDSATSAIKAGWKSILR